jgi:hypothetical protein
VSTKQKKKMAHLKALQEQILLFGELYETKANERQTESKEPQFRTCLYTRGISTVLFAEPKPMVFFMKAEAQVSTDSPELSIT